MYIFLIFIVFRVESLHLVGTWKGENSFLFLTKFGVQQTDSSYVDKTEGFIYGNITAVSDSRSDSVTLVVVDSEYFVEFYGNKSEIANTKSCNLMFKKIDTIAFDTYCNTQGKEDFLRTVPCKKYKLCDDEDQPRNVIPGYQFTYRIEDKSQPRFWYISLVACHHDNSNQDHCSWKPSNQRQIHIKYDIWLVNGNPSLSYHNPFEHQFSFEEHDTLEVYLIFVLVYAALIPIWLYAIRKENNAITWLLTSCMVIEACGLLLNLLHVIVFSVDGRRIQIICVVSNYLCVISECLLTALLLLMAKGWLTNQKRIRAKMILILGWTTCTILDLAALSYYTVKSQIDVSYTILNLDVWQTIPGYVMLGVRMLMMLWFLAELRLSTAHENNFCTLNHFLHFGAFYLVWFIYVPILVIVETQMSALWKFKVGLSISYSADFLAYAVLVHLLWPTRTVLYLVRREHSISTDELAAAGLISVPDSFHRDPPESGLETPGRHSPEFNGFLRLIDDPNTSSSETGAYAKSKGHNYVLLPAAETLSDDEL